MDDFWLQKAYQYIKEHRSFGNVGEVSVAVDGLSAVVHANVSVGLPARFVNAGITGSGVRSVEPVKFSFEKEFPLRAPKIILRNDFPRSFPHINISQKEVQPCIYEGDLSELLQQSEWMNGVLNQLVDWMEKAASESLISFSQGWEPMRNDSPAGYIIYDRYEFLDFLKDAPTGHREIYYEERNGVVVAEFETVSGKGGKQSTFLICQHPSKRIQADYCPNSILNLGDLYAFAGTIGLTGLNKVVEEIDSQHLKEEKMFVTLAIHRPCNIINSESNVELLNFIITKCNPRKKKKRVLPECSVGMLAHIDKISPRLLRKLAGTKQPTANRQTIALLGCGSLGSKIGLHLARNGNCPFLCVDHDIFLPHNNARHGLSLTMRANKAEQLALSISSISECFPESSATTASMADFSKSRIIIDTTASLAVRSFLMLNKSLPPIISQGIYGGGKLGISLIEATEKNMKIADLWAALYSLCLEREWLREIIFSEQKENVAVGQGCGTHTVIMKDASLSLFASSMSLIIQDILETSLPRSGEIVITRIEKGIDLYSDRIETTGAMDVPAITGKDWNVRVLGSVIEKMEKQSLAAGSNETGGCLIGSVFLVPKSIVITDILQPPPDSISTPSLFVLGKEGLKHRIKSIEKKTNGKITYLGTWHSHPHGGNASGTDKKTASRLLFVRNYEPTVCLIWTPKGLMWV